MKHLLVICLIMQLFSCKKEEVLSEQFSEASYKITITGTWKSPQFSVPAGAHFTYFSGMVHNKGSQLWKSESFATVGLEAIAETGYQGPLFEEVDSIIAKNAAITQINIPPPSPEGTITRTVYLNSNFSCISFASMIAPSPDWFVGVTGLNLYHSGVWLKDTTLQLYVYDAGTEDGDVFDYNNPSTIPRQQIRLLTSGNASVLANGNTSLSAIANVRITNQNN